MSERQELLELVRATRARLDWLRESGLELIEGIPDRKTAMPDRMGSRVAEPPEASVADPEAPLVAVTTTAASTGPAPNERPPTARTAGAVAVSDLFVDPAVRDATSLAALRNAIGDCQRCKLAPHRRHLVFGVGDPEADLVFVGEAPGRDEDVQGEPFVGRAGQLLTDIIVKGMKLRREDVYIANIIKCRPPQNRNPEADEIAACEPFLVRQLDILKPRAIVALGTFAAQALLRTRTPITRLRGTWADYHGIPLMPTFHPAYLLRSPREKRRVWQDIQQVMTALGLAR